MNTNYQYMATAYWDALRDGWLNAGSVPQQIEFSAPAEFYGQRNVWTPMHFLIGAVAGNFMTTFVTICASLKFELLSFTVSAVGTLEKDDNGLKFTRITIRPVATVFREADRDQARRLLEKAEQHCLIARSLRAEVIVDPEVLLQDPVPTM